MQNEDFIRRIIECPEYQKALEDKRHPCHDIVHNKDGSFYRCEPYRSVSCNEDVKVMFLGLSPGNPEKDLSPKKDAPIEEVVAYCKKDIGKGYKTNYCNAMAERIGQHFKTANYVKANVVHGIGDKESALKALETCGNRFLKDMIYSFPNLEYVIVYDFEKKGGKDGRVMEFVSEKLGVKLNFSNNKAAVAKEAQKKGNLTFIAAKRTQRYIRRLSEHCKFS